MHSRSSSRGQDPSDPAAKDTVLCLDSLGTWVSRPHLVSPQSGPHTPSLSRHRLCVRDARTSWPASVSGTVLVVLSEEPRGAEGGEREGEEQQDGVAGMGEFSGLPLTQPGIMGLGCLRPFSDLPLTQPCIKGPRIPPSMLPFPLAFPTGEPGSPCDCEKGLCLVS